MEIEYVDISAWPRKKMGEGTFAWRYYLVLAVALVLSLFPWLAYRRGPLAATDTQNGLLVAIPLLIIVIAAFVFVSRLRLRRQTLSNSPVRGVTVAEMRRSLRWLRMRIERSAGFPRSRRILLGYSLRALAIAAALGGFIAHVASRGASEYVLLGCLASSCALWWAGGEVLRPQRRDLGTLAQAWSLQAGRLCALAALIVLFLLGFSLAVHLLRQVVGEHSAISYLYFPFAIVAVVTVQSVAERLALLKVKAIALRHPRTRDVRRHDPRSPILFLRSFADDTIAVPHEMVGRLDDPIIAGLEEMIQKQIESYGPLIAIADPRRAATGGGARDSFDGEGWRQQVLEWMDEALVIVMIAGASEGVQWELQQAVKRDYTSKLIIILPEGEALASRWRHVCRCFSGTAWHPAMLGADVRPTLAVHFDAKGKIVMIASRVRSAGHYGTAVEAALYGVLCSE